MSATTKTSPISKNVKRADTEVLPEGVEANEKYFEYVRRTFDLLHVAPCDGFEHLVREDDGILYAYPLHAIATAKVSRLWARRECAPTTAPDYCASAPFTLVVGLALDTGFFHVVDEFDDSEGIYPAGSDATESGEPILRHEPSLAKPLETQP